MGQLRGYDRILYALIANDNYRGWDGDYDDLPGIDLTVLKLRDWLHGLGAERADKRSCIRNGSARVIEATLQRIAERCVQLKNDGEQVAVILYFCGHGKRGPLDAYVAAKKLKRESKSAASIPLGRISREHLPNIGKSAHHVFCVLDCCHAGGAVGRAALDQVPMSISRTAVDYTVMRTNAITHDESFVPAVAMGGAVRQVVSTEYMSRALAQPSIQLMTAVGPDQQAWATSDGTRFLQQFFHALDCFDGLTTANAIAAIMSGTTWVGPQSHQLYGAGDFVFGLRAQSTINGQPPPPSMRRRLTMQSEVELLPIIRNLIVEHSKSDSLSRSTCDTVLSICDDSRNRLALHQGDKGVLALHGRPALRFPSYATGTSCELQYGEDKQMCTYWPHSYTEEVHLSLRCDVSPRFPTPSVALQISVRLDGHSDLSISIIVDIAPTEA